MPIDERVIAHVPLRQLALAALQGTRTPIPAAMLREYLATEFGRRTTPRDLSLVVAKEPFAYGKSPRALYLAPALDSDGKPVRGWYTRSDWLLFDRILLPGSEVQAAARAANALNTHTQPDPWDADTTASIEQTIHALRHLAPRERTFGVRTRSAPETA